MVHPLQPPGRGPPKVSGKGVMSLLYNVLRSVSRLLVASNAGAALQASVASRHHEDPNGYVGVALVAGITSVISFYLEHQFKVKGPNE
jgi:hypothetical protein